MHDIAFFAVEQVAEQVKEGDAYIRAAIRRLDLKKMVWLSPLRIEPDPPSKAEEKREPIGGKPSRPEIAVKSERIARCGKALIDNHGVAILTYTVRRWTTKIQKFLMPNYDVVAERITYFPIDGDKRRWSKSMPWKEGRDFPDVYDSGKGFFLHAPAKHEPLTRVGEDIVLCPQIRGTPALSGRRHRQRTVANSTHLG